MLPSAKLVSPNFNVRNYSQRQLPKLRLMSYVNLLGFMMGVLKLFIWGSVSKSDDFVLGYVSNHIDLLRGGFVENGNLIFSFVIPTSRRVG